MKQINTYIFEKLKLNKDSYTEDSPKDILSFVENYIFVYANNSNINKDKLEILKNMISKFDNGYIYCLNNCKDLFKDINFRFIDYLIEDDFNKLYEEHLGRYIGNHKIDKAYLGNELSAWWIDNYKTIYFKICKKSIFYEILLLLH